MHCCVDFFVVFCQMLELQNRIGNDSRFQLDSRFIESGGTDGSVTDTSMHRLLSISRSFARDVTMFKLEFDDVRIFATSGIFDIRRIV